MIPERLSLMRVLLGSLIPKQLSVMCWFFLANLQHIQLNRCCLIPEQLESYESDIFSEHTAESICVVPDTLYQFFQKYFIKINERIWLLGIVGIVLFLRPIIGLHLCRF